MLRAASKPPCPNPSIPKPLLQNAAQHTQHSTAQRTCTGVARSKPQAASTSRVSGLSPASSEKGLPAMLLFFVLLLAVPFNGRPVALLPAGVACRPLRPLPLRLGRGRLPACRLPVLPAQLLAAGLACGVGGNALVDCKLVQSGCTAARCTQAGPWQDATRAGRAWCTPTVSMQLSDLTRRYTAYWRGDGRTRASTSRRNA